MPEVNPVPVPVPPPSRGWTGALVLKALTVLGCFGGALHAALPPPPQKPDYGQAYVLVLTGAGLLGFGLSQHKTGKDAATAAVASSQAAEVAAAAAEVNARKIDAVLSDVRSDVENMRQNPAQPGTPLTAEERHGRAAGPGPVTPPGGTPVVGKGPGSP